MDRDSALRLIAKLDALADPARNNNEGERDAARRKANSLRRRFDVGCEEAKPKVAPPRRFTAPQHGGAWAFDMRTGAHSPNVKVHRYNSVRDWKIEIL